MDVEELGNLCEIVILSPLLQYPEKKLQIVSTEGSFLTLPNYDGLPPRD